MTGPSDALPSDLAGFREGYAETFGTVPPAVEVRFALGNAVDPDFLRLAEALHTHAFYADPLDAKTVHLLTWGVLLALGQEPAACHAVSARRAGATWEELYGVVEVVCAVAGGLGVLDRGSAILTRLRSSDGAAGAAGIEGGQQRAENRESGEG